MVTPVPTKADDIISILGKLPGAPAAGSSTSEYLFFILNAIAIIALNALPMVFPNASVSTTYSIEGTIALFLFAVAYAVLRFVLKQSNLNLLSLAVTAYSDVQQAAAAANAVAQLPAVPATVEAAVTQTTTTTTTAAPAAAPAVVLVTPAQ